MHEATEYTPCDLPFSCTGILKRLVRRTVSVTSRFFWRRCVAFLRDDFTVLLGGLLPVIAPVVELLSLMAALIDRNLLVANKIILANLGGPFCSSAIERCKWVELPTSIFAEPRAAFLSLGDEI